MFELYSTKVFELDQLMYGARVFQRDFNWYLSYANQTHDFMDGMILSQGEVV